MATNLKPLDERQIQDPELLAETKMEVEIHLKRFWNNCQRQVKRLLLQMRDIGGPQEVLGFLKKS